MKKLILKVVATALCAVFVSLATPGCETMQQVSAFNAIANAPPVESVVVNAEKTLRISKDTFDLFLHVEKDNQALVKARMPQVHTFAEYLRKNAAGWLIDANNLKNAYKHGTGTLAALQAALNVISSNSNKAQQYINQLNQP